MLGTRKSGEEGDDLGVVHGSDAGGPSSSTPVALDGLPWHTLKREVHRIPSPYDAHRAPPCTTRHRRFEWSKADFRGAPQRQADGHVEVYTNGGVLGDSESGASADD